MRTVIVYRSGTENGRDVEGWLREFEYRSGKKIEFLDPDTRDGAAFCKAYDIVEYPTIIAVDSNGRMQNVWKGMPMPLINEVSYYV